jgi:prenyltransferase beta subunit
LDNEVYKRKALMLLDHYKRFQKSDGAFRVNEDTTDVMTHPHCYAAEGILYAYHVLNIDELFESAKKASNWLSKVQNPDGSFYRCYPQTKVGAKRRDLKTSDATAQATRIWKLLGTNEQGLERAYTYLKGELKDGGLRLFRNETLSGRLLSGRRAVYSWPTFFYLHSLILPWRNMESCDELF